MTKYAVYDRDGKFEGSIVSIESAAALVAFLGYGSKIRVQNQALVLWHEGHDFDGVAADSYDQVAETAEARINMARTRATPWGQGNSAVADWERRQGPGPG